MKISTVLWCRFVPVIFVYLNTENSTNLKKKQKGERKKDVNHQMAIKNRDKESSRPQALFNKVLHSLTQETIK